MPIINLPEDMIPPFAEPHDYTPSEADGFTACLADLIYPHEAAAEYDNHWLTFVKDSTGKTWRRHREEHIWLNTGDDSDCSDGSSWSQRIAHAEEWFPESLEPHFATVGTQTEYTVQPYVQSPAFQ